MTKRVAILQSNYLPWKGYFDLIHDVDTFVFLDDVQFTRQDWRNRNRFKTPQGVKWISVPVGDNWKRLIRDVELKNPKWQKDHYNSLWNNYHRCPFYGEFESLLKELYLNRTWTHLSAFNQHSIREIAKILGITTHFAQSSEYKISSDRDERLLDLLTATDADVYVSGPAAKSYLDEASFEKRGIQVEWKDYEGYPEYDQLYPPFEHAVTILDLLFHCGSDAHTYVWGWREANQSSQSPENDGTITP